MYKNHIPGEIPIKTFIIFQFDFCTFVSGTCVDVAVVEISTVLNRNEKKE
jgi:hypothetical protein